MLIVYSALVLTYAAVSYSHPAAADCDNGDWKDIGNNTYACVCYNNWSGDNCDIPVCANGGKSYGNICHCPNGYFGLRCDKGPCWDRGLMKTNGKCDCTDGFKGDACETIDSIKFTPLGIEIAILIMVAIIFLVQLPTFIKDVKNIISGN